MSWTLRLVGAICLLAAGGLTIHQSGTALTTAPPGGVQLLLDADGISLGSSSGRLDEGLPGDRRLLANLLDRDPFPGADLSTIPLVGLSLWPVGFPPLRNQIAWLPISALYSATPWRRTYEDWQAGSLAAVTANAAGNAARKRIAGALEMGHFGARLPEFQQLQAALPRPVRGSVLAPFGPQRRLRSFTFVRHPGVTYRVEPGTQVRTVAAGIVRYSGELYGYGRVVIVDHGQEYYSVYGYAGDCRFEPGAAVQAGTVLGRTGQVDPAGDRMYFEIRHVEEPLDPADWIAIPAPN